MGTMHSDKSWKSYGRKEPYYGVLGQDIYLKKNLDATALEDFFKSGEFFVNELFKMIHEKIDPDFKPKNILDFGCGPGRLTLPLTKHASEVIGVDISQEMLNEAEKNCLKFNVKNAKFFLSDDNLSKIQNRKFDLVISFIVMQHINIKRGVKLIEQLINLVESNGVGAIHFIYAEDFAARKWLNFFRHRIPYLHIIVRFIRCGIQGKKFNNLPLMQNNLYNINHIFKIIQKTRIPEVYACFTYHWRYMGIIMLFNKDSNPINQTH